MRTTTFLCILTIIFLITPLVCPLITAAKTEESSHTCPSHQQEQEDPGMQGCCDLKAIQTKDVETKVENSVEMLVLSASAAVQRIAVHASHDIANLHLKTENLLAKLSLLRM